MKLDNVIIMLVVVFILFNIYMVATSDESEYKTIDKSSMAAYDANISSLLERCQEVCEAREKINNNF